MHTFIDAVAPSFQNIHNTSESEKWPGVLWRDRLLLRFSQFSRTAGLEARGPVPACAGCPCRIPP